MLKKRIIPCLDISNGRTVKGTNFEGMQDAGDPIALAKQYARDGADELVFLDITATITQQKAKAALVEKIASEIDIPFTVGGGITTIEDVSILLQSGADKISINAAAVKQPGLLRTIADRFGSQCVVVATDIRQNSNGDWLVYLNGGKIATGLHAAEWAQEAERRGAGELLLTSIDHDGTKKGFACSITETISSLVNIPVIASGGAGSIEDFSLLFQQTKAAAALAAGIFHSGKVSIPALKKYLKTQNIPVR